jgi:hypothetical protein
VQEQIKLLENAISDEFKVQRPKKPLGDLLGSHFQRKFSLSKLGLPNENPIFGRID